MSFFSAFAKIDRAKILILILSLSTIGASLFSLDYITNRLLEREAAQVGMRWAEDIESSLNNLDKIFAGHPEKSNAPEVLHQLSTVGHIYRYELSDPSGKLVFDTSSDLISAQHATHEHKIGLKKSITEDGRGDHQHGIDSKSTTSSSNKKPKHAATLKRGDGVNQPFYYSYVIHPITKNGNHLGTLKLYIDQTEAQVLLRKIIFVILVGLSVICVLAFGVPTLIYLRGNTQRMRQQHNFDATLSIMHQGICIFDDDDNVILANDCFSSIYGLPPEHVKPGMSLDQIIELRIENGCYIGKDANEYRNKIDELKTNHSGVSQIHRLNDGRYVQIYNLPKANGGWLTIHEDVTAQTVAKQEIALQNEQFDVAISSISQGLCLFDKNRNLIVSNDRYATLFDLTPSLIRPGMSIKEIMQLRAEHGSFIEADAEDPQARINKWTQAPTDTTSIFKLSNGKSIEIFTHPKRDGGWLATMEDITDRLAAEELILQRSERLDAALETMPQGLCMLDADKNIIISNDQYAEMYKIAVEKIKPGTNLREIVELRIQSGTYAGSSPDAYRQERVKSFSGNNSGVQIHHLNDGRYIEIRKHAMANGGWLAMHEDITERTINKQAIALRNEQFDSAISNISQGLCLFDDNKNLIVSNERYATLFDLSPDQIKPGMHIMEIMKLRTEKGSFIAKGLKDIKERVDEWSRKSHDLTEILELTNGRIIELISHPMKGAGWLATMEDVTDRFEAQKKISLQNDQFQSAISNISQGLSLFDKDKKLIVCNDNYAKIFDLHPDMIKPGMHVMEIMQLRMEQGSSFNEDIESIRARTEIWSTNTSNLNEVFKLTNGHSIKTLSHPMRDGGWLATMEDVTDLVAAEAELTQHNERLDAALDTITQGLCMLDSDQNIIVSNDQYAKIYGISPELIKPGTSLQQVIDYRIENGTYAGEDPEKYRQERDNSFEERNDQNKIHHLKDGRYIEIREHPMANGGWLTMHDDVTERHISQKKIKHLADYDTLTGLPNRMQIQDALHAASQQAIADGMKMALLYIDLDGFKEINDTLGHPVGDHLLNEVGARLTEISSDTIVAGRLSGDEFVMVVREYDYAPYLERLADRICEALAAPFHIKKNVVEISASIGISVGPPDDGKVATLVQFADLALYQSKADGGNCYRFFEEKMYAESKERQRIATDLRTAIRNNELVLHYQPQIEMKSGKIIGYEALVRWQHDELGQISPLDFIGLAEETGQINEIGEWVLKTACEYAVTWPNNEKVSVNLSPVQFKRQDIITMVKKILWETGLEPERLELEITESVLIQSTDSVIITLRTLAEMGISIALDDFGTGFSSLSYLTTFPFNKIKIDKSFIDDLGKDTETTAVIAMIVGLGRSLNTVITAEGIENSNQHELLRASGCDQGQGYLYGKPLPEILEITEQKIKLNS